MQHENFNDLLAFLAVARERSHQGGGKPIRLQYFSSDPGCWSSFAQTDALANLLIEKGIITQQEFSAKILEERATYQAMLKPTSH
jgi:hypothetical protein